MAQQDLETIVQTLDRLTTGEKLALIERLARSFAFDDHFRQFEMVREMGGAGNEIET